MSLKTKIIIGLLLIDFVLLIGGGILINKIEQNKKKSQAINENPFIETKNLISNLISDISLIGYDFTEIELFDEEGKQSKFNAAFGGNYSILLRFFSFNCQDCYHSLINTFNELYKKYPNIKMAILTDFYSPIQLKTFRTNFNSNVPCYATINPQHIDSDKTYEPYILVTNEKNEIICSFNLSKNDEYFNEMILKTLINNMK